MSQVSPSRLNKYETCPALLKYDTLLGKGEITSTIFTNREAADNGIKFHEQFISEYFRIIPEVPTELEIKTTSAKVFDQYYGSNADSNDMTLLTNFIKFEIDRSRTWKTYSPTFIEKELFSDLFRGRIDFYGDNTILDWKTGFVNQVSNDMLRQGTIYKHLCESNNFPVKKMLFVALSFGRVLELPRTTLGWVEGQRTDYITSQKIDRFPAKPNSTCPNCPHLLRCYSEGRSLWL